MEDKFLPIGSVVLLKGGAKFVSITGYCPVSDTKEVYDYAGSPYPEGIIDYSKSLLFNHEQIEKVEFVGFKNDEYSKFNEKIKDTLKKIESGEIQKPF